MTEATATRRSARNVGKPVTATVAAAFTKPAPKRKAVAAATDQDASKDSKQNQKKRKATPIEKAINAATDSGTLKVGDKLPSFKLMIEDDNEIDTANLKNVILFSYPRANTSGCTTQAKLFRDNISSFTSAGYTVYGLSNDSTTTLSSWKNKQNFPYHLISDPKRQLIKSLTGTHQKTRRSHFVIDSNAKLAFVELSVKPVESWKSALEFVERHNK